MNDMPRTLADLVDLANSIRFDHNPTAIIVTPSEFAALKRVSVKPEPQYAGLPPFIIGTPVIVDHGDHVMRPGEVRLSDYLRRDGHG